MQPIALACHPSTPCKAIRRFEVRAFRTLGAALSLEYSVEGDIAGLCLPGSTFPRRADGLWQHTCFEAFLRSHDSAEYYEFNFAPSTEWAIYRFDAYREGLSVVASARPPKITLRRDAHRLELEAAIDLAGLALALGSTDLRLALSAVLEEQGGGLSYWALLHPPGKPDFHHPDGCALQLDRPDNSEYPEPRRP